MRKTDYPAHRGDPPPIMAEVMELNKSAAAGRQADIDSPGAQLGATTEVVEQLGPTIGQATQFA